MDPFFYETQRSTQTSLGLLLSAGGALFLWLPQRSGQFTDNALAAMGLGLLLLTVGLTALVAGGTRKVKADPIARVLSIETSSRFSGTQTRHILFGNVAAVIVARLTNDDLVFYHTVIRLKSGGSESLRDLSLDANACASRASALARCIGCSEDANGVAEQRPFGFSALAQPVRVVVALAVGMLVWAVYYRASVGPFCPAMWFGSAPILIVALTTAATFRLLGRVSGAQ